MEKKLFNLEEDDLNRLKYILAVDGNFYQVVNGEEFHLSLVERLGLFWSEMGEKYHFDPRTISLSDGERRERDEYQLYATPLGQEDLLISYCALCHKHSGPDLHSGCDKMENKLCAWYVDPDFLKNLKTS